MKRKLRPDGRLAHSDISSEQRLSQGIKTHADLWAACIGRAEQVDDYTGIIETLGFDLVDLRDNSQYEFTSDQAQGACQKYGGKSISLSAQKRYRSMFSAEFPLYIQQDPVSIIPTRLPKPDCRFIEFS